MPNTPYYKRLRDDEYYDKITISLQPRYKTSDMSGDEWRVSAVMQFWRKGHSVFEHRFSSMRVAASALPWFFETASEGNAESGFNFVDTEKEGLCFQPGCSEKAVKSVRLKKEYSQDGTFNRALADDNAREIRRKFCQKHSQRGDCGLEDCDENYEVLSKPED